MTLQRMPHDAFVKGMMSDIRVAKDFFCAHLPPTILEKIKLDTLRIEPCAFVDGTLKTRESDMLYSVQTTEGEPAYLFCLVEHQSTSDPLMAFRLSYYAMQILDQHIRQHKQEAALPLPLVYPVVLYNGKEKFTASRDIFTLFGDHADLAREIFLKPFQLIDVSTIDDEVLRQHQWAGILEWCLRHSIERDFLPYLHSLGILIHDLTIKSNDKSFLHVLHYILSGMETPEVSREAILALRREMPPILEKNIVTIAEQLYTEGKLEGEASGIERTLQAIKMLQEGFSIDEICQETGLSREIPEQLSRQVIH